MVQPVILERDPDGHITGERIGEPVAFYNLDQVQPYVLELQAQVDAANSPPGMEATNPEVVNPLPDGHNQDRHDKPVLNR